jgi:hypothetical protein
VKAGGKQSHQTLVSCLAYSSTLKMEATRSSETSVDFQRAACVISQKILVVIFTLFCFGVYLGLSEQGRRYSELNFTFLLDYALF